MTYRTGYTHGVRLDAWAAYEHHRGGRYGIRNERGLFKGKLPTEGASGNEREGVLIEQLGRQVRGLVEVSCQGLRADVATPEAVFEVEPIASWRAGFQQAAAYAWIRD